MKALYFDCFCGAAGDMIVGALLDAGAEFAPIKTALASLGVEGFSVRAERVKKKGVMATQFIVDVDETHAHPHRHLHHIEQIISEAGLPDRVKAASLETFRRIAKAEAEVHGTTPEKIHFHEVGAIDSIADIVATHLALEQLKPGRILSSPLHVGSGTVNCAHGVMPVPAPATALLLQGVPSYSAGVDGELVTPTGAALIAQLAQSFGPMPVLQTLAVGAGSGVKDLPDRPNILRVIVGELETLEPGTEAITIIEANIDDMNPELFPDLIDALLDAGARDAYLTPILGKKGRPGHIVTAMAYREQANAVTDALFRHSSTIGLRVREERRVCLPRREATVLTVWGPVRVKITEHAGERHTAAPEHDDCARVGKVAGVPTRDVYEAALAAAGRGDFEDV